MRIRLLFVLIWTAVLAVISPVASADCYLDDGNDLYSDAEEAYLMNLMEEASAHTGWNYGIVTVNEDFVSEYSAGMWAERIYNEQFGVTSSGVLFLCDVGWRYVVVAGEAREYVVGSRFDHMLDEMEDHYQNFRDMSCAKSFIERTQKYYDRGHGSFDLSIVLLIPAVILGGSAAALTWYCITKRYTTHEKPAVNNYLDVRQMDMYRRTDVFLRQHTHRYSNSSSGGRGSSGRSRGSRGGRGVGGFHGGGGRGGHR